MDLSAIIEKIAFQADDFLEGATSRDEARAGIMELLNADYRELSHPDKTRVVTGVMEILTEEEFFTHDPGVDGPASATDAVDGGDD